MKSSSVPSRRIVAVVAAGLTLACWWSSVGSERVSADEAAAQPAAKESKNPETAQPAELKTWDAAISRRREIYERLVELQKQHEQADRDGKLKIAQEYNALIREFEQTVYPRMKELAPGAFEKDPTDTEAAKVVMETAYGENRYGQAAKIADQLLATGQSSKLVLNIGGVSHFALHDFERARQLLKEANDKNLLVPQIGGPYLDASEEYIELWKKEQEVREREAAAEDGEKALPRVELDTSRGKIVMELFEDQAPNTVANFINLIEGDRYDGTKFHRVIDGFMVQGGDPNTLDDDPSNDGLGGPGYTIDCECYREDARKHFSGSLSMAHAGKDTGGSQFFITHLPTPHLNPNPERETGHTVFGRVIEGLDVVRSIKKGDTITDAKVLRKRDHEYKSKTNAKQ